MNTLSIVILAVSDVPRARDFYTALFGWTVRVDAGVFVQLQLPEGPDVGLYARAGFATNTAPPVAPIPAAHPSPAGHTPHPEHPMSRMSIAASALVTLMSVIPCIADLLV